MSALARAVEVHTTTIGAMMFGDRATQPETVDKVAKVLGRPRDEVYGWVGKALGVAEPFEPHADADLLDAHERKAVNELIRLLAVSKRVKVNDDEPTQQIPTIGPRGRAAGAKRAARRVGRPPGNPKGETDPL